LLGATILALVLLFDLELSRVDGLVLLAALGFILFLLVRNQQASTEVAEIISEELEELPEMAATQALTWLISGLLVLLISAEVLVWAASTIADKLGVDDIIVGLTVVAIGTSLPELAATIGSAIKGHTDIAIGNVVGSNILNVLAVLAVPALVNPTPIENVSLWRDCGMMLALTLAVALFAYGINSRPVITRFEGAVLLFAWVGYNLLLIQQAASGV
jgi:cation:H+ antiporter